MQRWKITGWWRGVALAAIVTGCGATPADPETAADEGHFPATMPMVTYYDPVPEGPMGEAVEHEAIASQQVDLAPAPR